MLEMLAQVIAIGLGFVGSLAAVGAAAIALSGVSVVLVAERSRGQIAVALRLLTLPACVGVRASLLVFAALPGDRAAASLGGIKARRERHPRPIVRVAHLVFGTTLLVRGLRALL